MVLKPQDVLVLLKILANPGLESSYNRLAYELDMSPSEVHAACKRAMKAGLAVQKAQGAVPVPMLRNLEEFLLHGVKYAFPAESGGQERGMPTAYAAYPLNGKIALQNDLVPVWPDAEGLVRGLAFSPLYRSVPKAARNDSSLYALLALMDAIRGGRARERKMAEDELRKRIKGYESNQRSELGNFTGVCT